MAQTQATFSQAEQQQWISVANKLSDLGFSAPEVLQRLTQAQGSVQPDTGGGGLLSAARSTLAKPVEWKDILWIVGGAIGIAAFLKLVGMAFEVSIPLIHTAEPVEDL